MLIEQSVIGWKEYEMEVMRDCADNAVIVCSIENFDPMGVHTGDSITVAPAQTLTDKEYQRMRDASLAILRKIGVETGGSNVQFAPRGGRAPRRCASCRITPSSSASTRRAASRAQRTAAPFGQETGEKRGPDRQRSGRMPACTWTRRRTSSASKTGRCSLRCGHRERICTSPDPIMRARVWSDVWDSGFKGHCPYFLRAENGMILLAHRIPNTALHWSADEGKTWHGPLEIDNVDGSGAVGSLQPGRARPSAVQGGGVIPRLGQVRGYGEPDCRQVRPVASSRSSPGAGECRSFWTKAAGRQSASAPIRRASAGRSARGPARRQGV